ncbi:hypothetical protein F4604DRAFT_207978 [Suillus subluteus]|nr:hypothetical protein F4604DRAFT_207978 [Suillus subluteus]
MVNDTLGNAPISTVKRERLSESEEYITPMKSIRDIAEEQLPIALKRESQVKAAQFSSSSLQLPTDTSQSHSSGLTPNEHDTWPPQKPSEVKRDSGYLSRFANRERDHMSRDTNDGRARYINSAVVSPTLDVTDRGFERPKHPSPIELDDMPRFARSAPDAPDRRSLLRTAGLSNRPVPPESWLPSTPEEDSLVPHIFTISRRGSTTIPSSTELHHVTASAKEGDRILTVEQQWSAIYRARDRRRTTSHKYIEARGSASAFERLDEDYPPTPPPHSSPSVAPNPRSVVPATRYSRSSGSPRSAAVPMGYSYSSDSLSSAVPMGYSHFPSSSQLPPPSASRPIAIKKLFSLDDDGFQSSPSPKDWDVPSRSPYDTYGFSHSPQTPDELPRSWQSSNFRTRLSSQDMRHGYQHVHQYDDDLDGLDLWEHDERRLLQREESFRRREEEISLREQELRRREDDVVREEEAKQKEDKPRREEKEAQRVEDEIMFKELEVVRQEEGGNMEGEGTEHEEDEDEIKWKEKLAKKKEEKAGRHDTQDKKRAEDLGRREESAGWCLEEDERHITRDVLRKSEESTRQEDEVKFREQASRTKEEKIRRKEEELARREEELSRREAEANRRHNQQKVQQEEFRKRVEEIRRQSVEEKTKQGRKTWGYHPRRTTPPPQISTSGSFSSSTGPWSISDHDERMSTANPPANRGRSTSISTSRSTTTWTSSTRLSSTASSWRSNISKPQTPSAQRNQPHQMSPTNSNELHMSAAGSPTADRGRTCTSRSNTTWTSSSRLSSNASLHLSSTPNPQIPSAHKNPPCQMSTSKSSSAGSWPIPSRNELHISATNLHDRSESKSTSTSRRNTPWTFSRLSSITRSQSSSTPKLQTPSSQKSSPPRSTSFSITGRSLPKLHDLHIPTTSPPAHKSRSKSTSTGRSSSTWAYSTRPIPTVSSQPSITPKSQMPSAQQNKKVAPCAMEEGAMEEEDSKGGGIKRKETQVRNRTVVVRPEEEKEERHIAHDRSAGSRRKEDEARLEATGAMHATEEDILKEEQPVRGKECDKPTHHWKYATSGAVTPEYSHFIFLRNNDDRGRRFSGRSDS